MMLYCRYQAFLFDLNLISLMMTFRRTMLDSFVQFCSVLFNSAQLCSFLLNSA